jgi:iron complex outermembrane receptor protein
MGMMQRFITSFWVLTWVLQGYGQSTDTIKSINLPHVHILDSIQKKFYASKQILAMNHREMKETASLTLADALTDLQGVTQLHTGPISKPVIRGLYGNRLQVNLGGLKLEDQQWEDEQGLALSEVGVQRVELIKGPGAVLYGSDAMGGVIRIIDDEVDTRAPFDSLHKSVQNLNLELFSNTYGFGLEYGLKKRVKQNQNWIINMAMESHADYSDGKGIRAPNTRFVLYNFKLGHHVQKGRWSSENRLYAAFNQFGFIKDSAELKEIEHEGRLSREFEDEHHNVLNLIFSNRNTYKINDQTNWNTTLGWQSNIRQEQEGEEETELGLSLHTLDLQSSIEKKYRHAVNWITGGSGKLQFNSNFGTRLIIPNATSYDVGLFSYISKSMDIGSIHAIFESGLRYDLRSLHSPLTENQSDPNHPFQKYDHNFNSFNYALGGSFTLGSLLAKVDLSTGFRNPNLAELFSNGRHEGTDRWDIGDLNMKSEFAFNKEVFLEYQLFNLSLRGSLFSNRVKNYIFISPTSERYQGFPLYRYQQSDVTLKGFEGGMEWNNHENISGSLDYSILNARRINGSWLPYSPANKLTLKLKFQFPGEFKALRNTKLTFRSTYTEGQDQVSEYESKSPAYWLLSCSIATEIRQMRLMLTCKNLTNTYYNDHLSILRNIGIRDIGRNIVLNAGITF